MKTKKQIREQIEAFNPENFLAESSIDHAKVAITILHWVLGEMTEDDGIPMGLQYTKEDFIKKESE